MKNIEFLAYPDMQSLDLMGPLDVFGTVNSAMPGKEPYRLHVVGLDANPVCAENRLVVTPTCTLDDAPAFDTLLIPGGLGSSRFDTHARLLDWLRDRAATTRCMVTWSAYAQVSTYLRPPACSMAGA